jgi:hypothetical protein
MAGGKFYRDFPSVEDEILEKTYGVPTGTAGKNGLSP